MKPGKNKSRAQYTSERDQKRKKKEEIFLVAELIGVESLLYKCEGGRISMEVKESFVGERDVKVVVEERNKDDGTEVKNSYKYGDDKKTSGKI